MLRLLLILLLSLSGCSNLPDLIKELAKDMNQNCVAVTTIYGGIAMGRAAPDSNIQVSAGQCTVTHGTAKDTLSVPVQIVPHALKLVPVD